MANDTNQLVGWPFSSKQLALNKLLFCFTCAFQLDSFSTSLTFSVNYYYYFSFNNFPPTLLLLHERLCNPEIDQVETIFHFSFRVGWSSSDSAISATHVGSRRSLSPSTRRGKSWPARNSSFKIWVASSIDDGFLHHFLCYSTNLSPVFFHSQQPLFIYFVLYFGPQLWSSRPWEKAAATPEKNGNLLIPSQSQQAKHIPASLNYFTIF